MNLLTALAIYLSDDPKMFDKATAVEKRIQLEIRKTKSFLCPQVLSQLHKKIKRKRK